MPFESKGQYNFGSKQAYGIISGYNKMLRDKKISSENDVKGMNAVPRTAIKQSGFSR